MFLLRLFRHSPPCCHPPLCGQQPGIATHRHAASDWPLGEAAAFRHALQHWPHNEARGWPIRYALTIKLRAPAEFDSLPGHLVDNGFTISQSACWQTPRTCTIGHKVFGGEPLLASSASAHSTVTLPAGYIVRGRELKDLLSTEVLGGKPARGQRPGMVGLVTLPPLIGAPARRDVVYLRESHSCSKGLNFRSCIGYTTDLPAGWSCCELMHGSRTRSSPTS